jgi:hypothetical protein
VNGTLALPDKELPMLSSHLKWCGVAVFHPSTLGNPVPDTIFPNGGCSISWSGMSRPLAWRLDVPEDTFVLGTVNILIFFAAMSKSIILMLLAKSKFNNQNVVPQLSFFLPELRLTTYEFFLGSD